MAGFAKTPTWCSTANSVDEHRFDRVPELGLQWEGDFNGSFRSNKSKRSFVIHAILSYAVLGFLGFLGFRSHIVVIYGVLEAVVSTTV